MKKLTCALAGALALGASAAHADDNFTFSGYFRSGTLLDTSRHFEQFSSNLDKERVGRLGLETDNYFEAAFGKGFDFDDGLSANIHIRFGSLNQDYDIANSAGVETDNVAQTLYGQSIDGQKIGLIESYVELNGLFPDKDITLWGGKRYYRRTPHYIFTNDFFYTDYSGTGFGIQHVPFGGGEFEAAYIAADVVGSNDFVIPEGYPQVDIASIENNLHFAYQHGPYDVDFLIKQYPTNHGTPYAENGFEGTLVYTFDSFFGTGLNGSAHGVFQFGRGLGSGPGLGFTVDNYGGYVLGNGPFDLVTQAEDDWSYRGMLYGGYIGSSFLVFPEVYYQYDDYGAGGGKSTASFVVRPVFPITTHFSLQFEAGADYLKLDSTRGPDPDSSTTQKLTFAPTFTINEFGGEANIRLLAVYQDGNNLQAPAKGLQIGAQASAVW